MLRGLLKEHPVMTLVLAVALVGSGAWLYGELRDRELIDRYCRYGSVSAAQLETCREHVRADEIRERGTVAARYARDEIDTCGSRAGRFCEGQRVGTRSSPSNESGIFSDDSGVFADP
ncbi:MAG: hypothetical protein JHC84_02075 [Solirubrobacteraceae bacterium]|nr:hypothetical protein [Solirubrobacteraceae bacterium]